MQTDSFLIPELHCLVAPPLVPAWLGQSAFYQETSERVQTIAHSSPLCKCSTFPYPFFIHLQSFTEEKFLIIIQTSKGVFKTDVIKMSMWLAHFQTTHLALASHSLSGPWHATAYTAQWVLLRVRTITGHLLSSSNSHYIFLSQPENLLVCTIFFFLVFLQYLVIKTMLALHLKHQSSCNSILNVIVTDVYIHTKIRYLWLQEGNICRHGCKKCNTQKFLHSFI